MPAGDNPASDATKRGRSSGWLSGTYRDRRGGERTKGSAATGFASETMLEDVATTADIDVDDADRLLLCVSGAWRRQRRRRGRRRRGWPNLERRVRCGGHRLRWSTAQRQSAHSVEMTDTWLWWRLGVRRSNLVHPSMLDPLTAHNTSQRH